MANSNPEVDTALRGQLEKLAAFEPQDAPVLSLYLNLTPDQHGRDNYDTFVRKVLGEHQKAFRENTPERTSYDRDVERINAYLAEEVNRSANGLALFACAGAGEFFHAVQLEAPLAEHWFFVGGVPHLYPLARVSDQYPRYASVVLDTNRARIFVFDLGAVQKTEAIEGTKTRRSSMGGWSQARYQRRAENFHLNHVKEVVDTLDEIVRREDIDRIIVAGDDVVVPLVREQMPKHLLDKLVDVLALDHEAPEHEIVEATMEALRKKDAESDAERVGELLGAWQSGGLGAVGPEAVLSAFQLGQVDELVITGSLQSLKPVQTLPDDATPEPIAAETSAPAAADERQVHLAGELVARAQQTGASIRFIEDPALLEEYGGVGAFLRFRV